MIRHDLRSEIQGLDPGFTPKGRLFFPFALARGKYVLFKKKKCYELVSPSESRYQRPSTWFSLYFMIALAS